MGQGEGIGGSEAGLRSGESIENFDWDEFISGVVAMSGWTWTEVESRTIPELAAVGRAWRKAPPLPAVVSGILVALGAVEPVEAESEPLPEELTNFAAKELLRQRLQQFQADGAWVGTDLVEALEKQALDAR